MNKLIGKTRTIPSGVEISPFQEHIIRKFTLPKYPELDFCELADYELQDMKNVIEYICQAQRNACARVYEADYIDKGRYNIYDYINTAEIKEEDYE